ncbi:MAG TPA: tannase/feruloyl esterase family alpha/beta hydrolase [Magnetospirillaceae bacterium]|jgi:feruloyl esterase
MMGQRIGVFAVSTLALVVATGTSAHATDQKACADLARLKLAHVKVATASLVAANAQFPEHCLLQGSVDDRTGSDGKHYAIGFEMRLPTDWNGRFLYQLNGGNDGEVIEASGDPKNLNAVGGKSALSRGFVVLSTDSGHSGKDPANKDTGLVGSNIFGLDEQARLDYGYTADATMTPIAKAIIRRHYRRKPDYSYMEGCSNGGRHVMVDATRLGGAYDGFIAGDPGFDLPKAAIQHAWDIQSFTIANPDIRKAFSPEDMNLIASKVLEKCDALDGAADGMVDDLRKCQTVFHLADLKCTGEKTPACLSAAQVTALDRAFGGPKNSAGQQLYSDWPYDAGMGAHNWRFWKLESGIPPWDDYPLIATMGAGSLSYIFTTPPTDTAGKPDALLAFLKSFDFDKDAPKIFATAGAYRMSAMAFMTPPDAANPKLAKLRSRGHKLIVYHGQSDGVFSVNDTIRWYETLAKNSGGSAVGFARLYTVPGMNHCSGGPATDSFDMLTAMTEWVEKRKAPDHLVARVSAANKELPVNWSKRRTRPLCNWPLIAKYKGGDMESADSFVCAPPG